jgi:hypothetical protein
MAKEVTAKAAHMKCEKKDTKASEIPPTTQGGSKLRRLRGKKRF